ncbi:MAG: mechanosensitive ion channel family protein [Saprospiraceae bacterium]
MEFVKEKLLEVGGQLIGVLPSLLGALTVLIVGWLFAKLFSRIIEKILKAIKVDTLAEKFKSIDVLDDITIKPSVIISRILYYLIMLIVVAVSADLMALKILSTQVESLIEYIPNLITAGLIMVFGLLLANMVKELLSTTFRSLGISSGSIISNFVFYFLFITIALSALSQASIKTAFIENNLTIIIGGIMIAFAIGYGYASRNVMANFLGSLYSKPKFRIGDIIEVNEIKGKIIGMDNTSMLLRTADDRRIVIPLSLLTHNKVEIFENLDEATLIDESDED